MGDRTFGIAVVTLVAGLLSAGSAWAQSKKYPPEPVDKDEQDAQQSRLWDQATNPAQLPYQELVADAQKLLADGTSESTQEAIKKLDQAIPLMPNDATAYRLRGDGHMAMQSYKRCAADYDAAWTRLMRDADAKNPQDLRFRLGVCQARDGKLADAERTLAETAATGVNSVEIWMRLGEVRIAMGKLEGAIAALEAAQQQTDLSGVVLVKWLLAGAYDRARRPSEARRAATEALVIDRQMTTLKNPPLVDGRLQPLALLSQEDASYLLGLAYEAHNAETTGTTRPENALVQFRWFAKVAGASPWRKRADEHIRELKSARLPDSVERLTGNAPYDDTAMRDTVRKAMPAMRACLAKTPLLVLRVEVTRSGPKGPESARWHAPPDGTLTKEDEMFDTPSLDKDAAIRCVDALVNKLSLARPKEKEAYYKIGFRVVGN